MMTLMNVIMAYALAATVATTTDGRTVILMDDGTWTAYSDAKAKKAGLYQAEAAPEEVADPNAAPDCASVLKTKTDRVTGNTITSINAPVVVSPDGRTGLVINLFKSTSGSLILSTTAVGASACVDDDTKINVLFADGKRMELISDGKFNCDGNSVVYFGGVFGKQSQLNDFATRDISIMRVWTRDGYVEREFLPEQARTLRSGFSCLM